MMHSSEHLSFACVPAGGAHQSWSSGRQRAARPTLCRRGLGAPGPGCRPAPCARCPAPVQGSGCTRSARRASAHPGAAVSRRPVTCGLLSWHDQLSADWINAAACMAGRHCLQLQTGTHLNGAAKVSVAALLEAAQQGVLVAGVHLGARPGVPVQHLGKRGVRLQGRLMSGMRGLDWLLACCHSTAGVEACDGACTSWNLGVDAVWHRQPDMVGSMGRASRAREPESGCC